VESLHAGYRPRGLPRWTLWAAIPVVLALGFVAGLAIANYAPSPAAEAAPPPTKQIVPPVTVAPSAKSSDDFGWQIVTVGPANSRNTPGSTPQDSTASSDVGTQPSPHFTGKATNRLEARLALATDFPVFRAGNISFHVEYQLMRAGAGTSLVGLLADDEYPQWERAVREQPDALKSWLTAAAGRVQDASARDRFHVAWAVVDVLRERPAAYADSEITVLENRTYLVIRPLAATLDHTKSEISLRPLASLLQSAANQQVTSSDPWAAYGPVIRFDADDLYRPLRTNGQQPIARPGE
jgi:hypothetical protein